VNGSAMRAIVVERFGGPEVLELKEIERPQPGPGELLVRVVCAGTNPVDAKLRQFGGGRRVTAPVVLGYDVSGIVEAVGPGVTRFRPGDEVYYMLEVFGRQLGAYAEYNVVPEAIVARKPAALSHEEAAAVPLACGTAWEGIVRRLKVQPGETVLVHAGAGGVGSFAVQLAKACGARVIASAGPANQETLRSLGVDVAVDYTQQDPVEVALEETGGQGVDAVFDAVGGELIARSIRATKPFGRMATILDPAGSLDRLAMKNLTLFGILITPDATRLEEMGRLIGQGKLRPLVDKVYPLEQVQEAHRRLDTGHGRGKMVLRVAP